MENSLLLCYHYLRLWYLAYSYLNLHHLVKILTLNKEVEEEISSLELLKKKKRLNCNLKLKQQCIYAFSTLRGSACWWYSDHWLKRSQSMFLISSLYLSTCIVLCTMARQSSGISSEELANVSITTDFLCSLNAHCRARKARFDWRELAYRLTSDSFNTNTYADW